MSVVDCFNVLGIPKVEDLLLASFVQDATDEELVAALVGKGEAGNLYAAHLLARIFSGNHVAIRTRVSDALNSGIITIDRCDIAGHFVDQRDAFKWTQIAAQSGNTDDLYALASFYANGMGCQKDPLHALELAIQVLALGCSQEKDDDDDFISGADLMLEIFRDNPDLMKALAKGVKITADKDAETPVLRGGLEEEHHLGA